MGGISNGQIPEGSMVVLASGGDKYGEWKHLAPAGTAARLRWLFAKALEKYGVRLYVTPGWNIYRPLRIQYLYRADLGIWAAWPGTSSHGGIYNGKPCMAADIANWRDLADSEALAWSRFVALCRLAGFTVNFVTPQELWHIGDFNDIWAVPAALSVEPFKPATELEEDEMWYFTWKANGKAVYCIGDLNDAEKIPHGEAAAINAVRGGKERFVEVSITDASTVLDGIRRRRARSVDANATEAVKRLEGMLRELSAEGAAGATA